MQVLVYVWFWDEASSKDYYFPDLYFTTEDDAKQNAQEWWESDVEGNVEFNFEWRRQHAHLVAQNGNDRFTIMPLTMYQQESANAQSTTTNDRPRDRKTRTHLRVVGSCSESDEGGGEHQG